MATDLEWTWTIIMTRGRIFHDNDSINLYDLLTRYENAGHHEAEIEAIIRH
jgi:hypothetical protein